MEYEYIMYAVFFLSIFFNVSAIYVISYLNTEMYLQRQVCFFLDK